MTRSMLLSTHIGSDNSISNSGYFPQVHNLTLILSIVAQNHIALICHTLTDPIVSLQMVDCPCQNKKN